MVLFVTSNLNKFVEIKEIFKQNTTIKLDHLNISLIEIQSASLEEIAIFSLKECIKITGNSSVFVEDTGLFIESLNGFPGPYSAFIINTIGLNGILTLLNGRKNRKAIFQSCIALKFEDKIKTFSGQIKGQISRHISNAGWGYDPIFIPECNGKRTFGELGQKKNTMSHRFLAAMKLINYLNCT
ncbi:MAG: RdgB/HAM1 family non-canonical purine NTP pyrophosphatase [Candidatus Hodarchaeota archaeon]